MPPCDDQVHIPGQSIPKVSILVLVDAALRPGSVDVWQSWDTDVSILVLVDAALRQGRGRSFAAIQTTWFQSLF